MNPELFDQLVAALKPLGLKLQGTGIDRDGTLRLTCEGETDAEKDALVRLNRRDEDLAHVPMPWCGGEKRPAKYYKGGPIMFGRQIDPEAITDDHRATIERLRQEGKIHMMTPNISVGACNFKVFAENEQKRSELADKRWLEKQAYGIVNAEALPEAGNFNIEELRKVLDEWKKIGTERVDGKFAEGGITLEEASSAASKFAKGGKVNVAGHLVAEFPGEYVLRKPTISPVCRVSDEGVEELEPTCECHEPWNYGHDADCPWKAWKEKQG